MRKLQLNIKGVMRNGFTPLLEQFGLAIVVDTTVMLPQNLK